MVHFYIANTVEEAEFNKEYIGFPEKLHAFFQEEFKNDIDMSILTELPFYGNIGLFDMNKIKLLLELSHRFECYNGKNKKNIKVFFKHLEKLCTRALEKNKSLIAIGD